MWSTLSDERMGLSFTIAADPRQRSHSRVESGGTCNRILLSQIRDTPNLEGQVPVFISPRIRVAQFYPQVLGSLLIVFYDSQGYGRGSRTCLHGGQLLTERESDLLYDWRFTANQFVLAPSPLRITKRAFFF
jgi:hypothetical protein